MKILAAACLVSIFLDIPWLAVYHTVILF